MICQVFVYICSLELCFGNLSVILNEIFRSVKLLPSLDSGRIDLMNFSLQLRNAVHEIKSLRDIGYLYSPEFKKKVSNKLPECML